MLNFNSLLLFSDKPNILADFYKKVFQVDPDWSEGEYSGFQVGKGYIIIGPHDKVHGKSPNPERMMFNLETSDVKGEFERIKQLGAKVIKEPYHPKEADENNSDEQIATFTDPDGNYFQLMSPYKQ